MFRPAMLSNTNRLQSRFVETAILCAPLALSFCPSCFPYCCCNCTWQPCQLQIVVDRAARCVCEHMYSQRLSPRFNDECCLSSMHEKLVADCSFSFSGLIVQSGHRRRLSRFGSRTGMRQYPSTVYSHNGGRSSLPSVDVYGQSPVQMYPSQPLQCQKCKLTSTSSRRVFALSANRAPQLEAFPSGTRVQQTNWESGMGRSFTVIDKPERTCCLVKMKERENAPSSLALSCVIHRCHLRCSLVVFEV
ncbi:hypothetical protein F5888DRAFT_1696341 [Russula emetica]|nr:hypothetical protein F5888DRAFT_1696341 [Russula emetica]